MPSADAARVLRVLDEMESGVRLMASCTDEAMQSAEQLQDVRRALLPGSKRDTSVCCAMARAGGERLRVRVAQPREMGQWGGNGAKGESQAQHMAPRAREGRAQIGARACALARSYGIMRGR